MSPTKLQKRLLPAPADTNSANDQRTTSDQSPRNDSHRSGQTYAIDIVQRVRVTSDQPLTRHKIDAVKKSLGKLGHGTGTRGYVSDDDGSGLRVTQTALEVVRGSSAKPPQPPPRPHSASPGGSAMQKQDQRPSHTPAVQPPQRILFYHAHDPHYGFTNFSPDVVEYQGKRYPTSEHLFQSLKAQWCLTDVLAQFLDHRPELAEHIRTCSNSPRFVFDETHRFNPEVRRDWLHVRVDMMDMVLWHKFTQNDHLKRELLDTGDAELVEDSDKDAFWGVGPNGRGENQLGKALQRLRAKLRNNVSSHQG